MPEKTKKSFRKRGRKEKVKQKKMPVFVLIVNVAAQMTASHLTSVKCSATWVATCVGDFLLFPSVLITEEARCISSKISQLILHLD